jgi:hypothetical protein
MQDNKKNQVILRKIREIRIFLEEIEREAEKNEIFRETLSSLFQLDSEERLISKPRDKKNRVPILNIVDILHKSGIEELNKALNFLSNDQLIKLANQEGIKKNKDSKSLDRKVIIDLLIELAGNRLSQGASFNKPISVDDETNNN